MGLFMQRPEEPSEWAGLPAEPHRRERADGQPTAAHLPDAAPADADLGGLLEGVPGATVASISIPVEVPDAAEADAESDESD